MAPCKWIVNIQKNGLAVEVEVIGDSAHAAQPLKMMLRTLLSIKSKA
jgi:hypothetical protein